MDIISWNVGGLRAVLKKGFLEFIDKEKPDIICIQETKSNGKESEKELRGYQVYWNDAQKKGYVGTAVFTKTKPIKVTYGMGIHDHDKEGRIITLEFAKYFLVNVYTPNSGRGLSRLSYRKKWDRDFVDSLKRLDMIKPLIVCGDFNVAHTEIDLANPKANYNKTAGYTQAEIDGFNALLKAGFTDTFRHFHPESGYYTFWTYMFNARSKNIGWRIDYFLVSSRLIKNVEDSLILSKVMGSDHCPIRLILSPK